MKYSIALLAILLVSACSGIRYCEVQEPDVNIFSS